MAMAWTFAFVPLPAAARHRVFSHPADGGHVLLMAGRREAA
jgi:hypothetical protein